MAANILRPEDAEPSRLPSRLGMVVAKDGISEGGRRIGAMVGQ